MIKHAVLVVAWFPLAIILILINLSLLSNLSTSAQAAREQAALQTNHRITATAETAKILGASVIAGDSRGFLLHQFLLQHGSPMAPYADLIVKSADDYGLDFRLLVSIAMCESNLGKHMPSSHSFNPFGIAVYTGQINGKNFASWEDAITWVSKYIKESYYDKGIINLTDIGAIWAPPSVNTGNSWANCVREFQQSIL